MFRNIAGLRKLIDMGLSPRQASDILGVCIETVRDYIPAAMALPQEGGTVKPNGHGPSKYFYPHRSSKVILDRNVNVVADARAGMNMAQLRDKYKLSKSRIYQILDGNLPHRSAPYDRHADQKYPMRHMQVGDSFFVPGNHSPVYKRAQMLGITVTVRTEGHGHRVWRIA